MPDVAAVGLSTVNGLPAHILIVHAVVVLVPLTAVALIAALRPSIARRFGVWLPALAAAAFVSVLAAMNAGGWLQSHVKDTSLVRRHTSMAGGLWPLSALVLVMALVVWWTAGRSRGEVEPTAREPHRLVSNAAGRTATAVSVGVLSVLVAVGSVVQVVRIGDSGSRAAWSGTFSHSAASPLDG